jgi:hypothetical protein
MNDQENRRRGGGLPYWSIERVTSRIFRSGNRPDNDEVQLRMPNTAAMLPRSGHSLRNTGGIAT